jgi:hypothetical protein
MLSEGDLIRPFGDEHASEHIGSDLRTLERRIHRDEITAEVVELASGAGIGLAVRG